jgi:hypothetical protein
MLDFSGTERALSARVMRKLKKRLEPPQRPILNAAHIRRETIAKLAEWFSREVDKSIYDALANGDENKLKTGSFAISVISKRPPKR